MARKQADWRELEKDDLIVTITEARDEGKSWTEIKEMSGGMSLGKLMHLWEIGQVKPKDRIEADSDEEYAEAFQEARENHLSWGIISARAGMPESRVRKIYETAYGEGSSKIEGGAARVKGKRGVVREEGDEDEKPAKKAAAKKAPAKKAAKATKAASKKAASSNGTADGVKNLQDMDLDELAARLNGKTITVKNSTTGKSGRVGVKEVISLNDGEMEFTSKTGSTRVIKVSAIEKASR